MKMTKSLTHILTDMVFEPAMDEDALLSALAAKGLEGFPAELDIAERTEDHVQMMQLDTLARFARSAGAVCVTYDITYFPHADEAEVDYQLGQLSRDLEIDASVIRRLCEAEIEEYLALDAKRDTDIPVHNIVEAYMGGTSFAWYGMNDYPRLKRVILRKLAQGGEKAKREFVRLASEAQAELEGFTVPKGYEV